MRRQFVLTLLSICACSRPPELDLDEPTSTADTGGLPQVSTFGSLESGPDTDGGLGDHEQRETPFVGFCREDPERVVEFRDELPKINVGKILRRALRD